VTPSEVLDLSDERDLWLRRLLAAERAAFTRGRAIGRQEGYAAGLTHCDREWMDALAPARAAVRERNPAHAELERRRWGPEGREHFADPRPGDYPGRGRDAQAESAA
jgi:hypothetical protein